MLILSIISAIILLFRKRIYDSGVVKHKGTDVRSVTVGNLAVGGTGKTPMTELILRTLLEDSCPYAEPVIRVEDMEYDGLFAGVGVFDGNFGGNGLKKLVKRNVAVLSRGYGRKSKGFLYVEEDGTTEKYGDEPLQIKRKFPSVTVAVDADRVVGVEHLQNHGCDFIVLDDAFQYRKLNADASILLTTFNRPYFKDFILPLGRLRDVRSRANDADMIIVTKCPTIFDDTQRMEWAGKIGLKDFDLSTCRGVNSKGRLQYLLFATVLYEKMQAVFPDGDPRYVHSGLCMLFSGIADDSPLQKMLCESYRIVEHMKFRDHHNFSASDIASVTSLARRNPTAVLVTTEKDAQRLMDKASDVPSDIKRRVFYVPIRAMLLSAAEHEVFKRFLIQGDTCKQ